MPDLTLDNGAMNVKAASGFHFSAASPESLEACEYTLVGIACDVSGSVAAYERHMENCLGEIVGACKHSARADNLMLRFVQFAHDVRETHGFKPLVTIGDRDYHNVLNVNGSTALYDATYALTESVIDYGRILTDQDYDVNAIVFVITDGCDNASSFTPARIRGLKKRVVREECLESLLVVLVGVDVAADPDTNAALDLFRREAELDEFVSIGKANAKSLAKLAAFVSQSISSQSQALTSGTSAILTF